jgi:hypothetical protein
MFLHVNNKGLGVNTVGITVVPLMYVCMANIINFFKPKTPF